MGQRGRPRKVIMPQQNDIIPPAVVPPEGSSLIPGHPEKDFKGLDAPMPLFDETKPSGRYFEGNQSFLGQDGKLFDGTKKFVRYVSEVKSNDNSATSDGGSK